MIKKVLTYFTILAITALPVQLISASVKSDHMMSQMSQMNKDCMHGQSTEQISMEKACCGDQSHQCQSCNNCPQAASSLFLSSNTTVETPVFKTKNHNAHYLFLSGIHQKNLLRPPRTSV